VEVKLLKLKATLKGNSIEMDGSKKLIMFYIVATIVWLKERNF
jgi:hypothetical protein